MTAAFVLVKTARDALFFTGGGIEALPNAYLGIATLSLPLALATVALMRVAGPQRTRVILPLASAALFAFAPSTTGGSSAKLTFFFMTVPLLFGVMFSSAWLLGGELLEGALHEDRVEAYRWIGAASILGGALGGIAARALAALLQPAGIMAAGCGCLVASAAVMAWTQARFRVAAIGARAATRPRGEAATGAGDPPGEAPRESPPPVAGLGVRRGARRIAALGARPYIRRLVGVAMIGALTGVLVEFLFYLLAASSTRSMGGNARFFANAYLIMNVGAFLLQVVAFGPLQRWIGVTGMLMALPLVLFGGASALLAGLAMTVGPALRIAEGGVKQSIHRSSWEQAFLPVERRDRGLAKLIVDGASARIAEGFAAGLLVLWIHFGLKGRAPVAADWMPIAITLVVATLAWLVLARAMRAQTIRHALAHPEDRCRPDSPLPDG